MEFKKHVLDISDWENFLSLTDSSRDVATLDDFKEWTRGGVQAFLPHEMLFFDCGDVRCLRVTLRGNPGIAGEAGDSAHILSDFIDPLVNEWCKTFRPQLFESDALEVFRRSGPGNILLHGQRSIEGSQFAYFAFCGIPEKLTMRHVCLAELLVPQFCSILSRVKLHQDPMVASAEYVSLLTKREKEILRCFMMGKTNWEAGRLLGISGETVKTHTKHIFDKLKVCTRSQAVAKINDLGLM